MKNTFKKITSVILAVIMVMSISVTVFAAPGSGTPIGDEYEQYEYVLERVDHYLEDTEEETNWTRSEENPHWSYRLLEDGTIRVSARGYPVNEEPVIYNITIPTSLDGYTVSEFRHVANWDTLSVTIPDTITEIGYCSIYNIKNLKRVVIPTSVKSIEVSALDSGAGLNSEEGLEIYYCGTEEQWNDIVVWNVANTLGDRDYWAVTNFDWLANPHSGVGNGYDEIPSYIKKVHFNVDPTTLEDLVPEEEPTIWEKIAQAFQDFSNSIVVFFEKIADWFASIFA